MGQQNTCPDIGELMFARRRCRVIQTTQRGDWSRVQSPLNPVSRVYSRNVAQAACMRAVWPGVNSNMHESCV
jgi:hypothetical protein